MMINSEKPVVPGTHPGDPCYTPYYQRFHPRFHPRFYPFTCMVVVVILYFAAARFGLSLAFSTKLVTALWPPTGIAVAAIFLLGYRVWPAIFIAAFAINLLIGGSIPIAACIAVGNTLAPILAVFGLRRLSQFDGTFASVRDVFALILFGAVLGMLISATNGVTVLALGGVVPWPAFFSVWWIWWLGDAMGVLIFTPLILGWILQPRPHWSRRQQGELALLVIGTWLTSSIALAGALLTNSVPFQLQYAVFPFIIWAGLRFTIRETTSCITIATGLAVWGAVHNHGPFISHNMDQSLILLEMFMAIVTITGLFLSAATKDRTLAQQALQSAHDTLEERVQRRTAELAESNRVLGLKNQEVEAFVYIVSHDLRAPLVNLQGFSKELELGCKELRTELALVAIPESNKKAIDDIIADGIVGSLRYISASTTKFQRLIDALLLLSRTGKNDYHKEYVDVQALVETTLASLRKSIPDNNTVFTVTALPAVMGDATAIGQVFSNLISNAMKYLQPGRAGEIGIGGETQDGITHYWIRDNGAGIPPSSQGRLFQVFQRFHPNLAPGEGMGLAIVKRIIERHQGEIRAESIYGIGTVFHFSLPAIAGTESLAGAKNKSE